MVTQFLCNTCNIYIYIHLCISRDESNEHTHCSTTVANHQLIIVIRFVAKSYTHSWKDFANRLHLILRVEVRKTILRFLKWEPNEAFVTYADRWESTIQKIRMKQMYSSIYDSLRWKCFTADLDLLPRSCRPLGISPCDPVNTWPEPDRKY